MSAFTDKVIEITNLIPKGKVVSYGQVALMAGVPRGARQVGWILHQFGDKTPWWRVINNAGRISTKCLEHDANMQKEFLKKEGVQVTKKLNIDIENYRWRPSQEMLDKLALPDKYIFEVMEKF